MRCGLLSESLGGHALLLVVVVVVVVLLLLLLLLWQVADALCSTLGAAAQPRGCAATRSRRVLVYIQSYIRRYILHVHIQ
jgi:hypothetical protein